jgi:hypothetical protein
MVVWSSVSLCRIKWELLKSFSLNLILRILLEYVKIFQFWFKHNSNKGRYQNAFLHSSRAKNHVNFLNICQNKNYFKWKLWIKKKLEFYFQYTFPITCKVFEIIIIDRQNSPFWAIAFLRRLGHLVFTSFGYHNSRFFTEQGHHPWVQPQKWRSRSLYLCPLVTGWPICTHRHHVPFSSPSMTHRATVEVL